MIHLGKIIRRLRIEREISQHELAQSAGVTPSFLSLIENERRRPSLRILQKLASALEVPEDVLIWDAIELPANLPDKDKRLCEMAKLIVRRFYETGRA